MDGRTDGREDGRREAGRGDGRFGGEGREGGLKAIPEALVAAQLHWKLVKDTNQFLTTALLNSAGKEVTNRASQ